MSGFLFNEIVFGPVYSRRLGISLGINLLPTSYKNCTFNCIYCECGWTIKKNALKDDLPEVDVFVKALRENLSSMKDHNKPIDTITFAGNGEPTLHPQFDLIVDETLRLRDEFYPSSKIAVLSNATNINNPKVFQALQKIDKNILKLDAGSQTMFQRINKPLVPITLEEIVQNIKKFKHVIVQTLFLKGNHEGKEIDNTKEEELELWLQHLQNIKPQYVMIYPFARQTPAQDLVKIEKSELERIAKLVNDIGLETEVYE